MEMANLLLLQDDTLHDALRSGTAADIVFTDGTLQLAPGAAEGTLESAAFPLPAFTTLVASWNSTTPRGTFVELSVQVNVQGTWTRWFTYGKWADGGANIGSVADQWDEKALLDVDLLRVLDGSADAVRFKLHLSRTTANETGFPTASPDGSPDGSQGDSPGDSPDRSSAGVAGSGPRVRLIAFTFSPVAPANRPYVHEEVALSVPTRAQLPIPDIGRIICSPTSLAMVMNYYGHEEDTERVAAGARDNGAGIYGNWSYNVAYAGEKGFTAWVERCDSFEDVKNYLKQGIPVVASIRTAKDEPLPGAVMPYPAGHLLVVTGLTEEDGEHFVLVNDPAAHADDDVPRRYPLERFLQTWRNVIYVMKR